MIDIHAHYLPEIDDGAKNVAESLEMLKSSFSQGISVCVATPHSVIHCEEDIERFIKKREASYQRLIDAAAEENCKVPKLILGTELYLDHNVNQYHGIEKLCIENTNALLMEFPIGRDFSKHAEDWIYDLNCKGIVPIIAHIDRYPFWERMLKDFQGLRVNYQINASKFLTLSGRSLIRKIMKYDNKYIISSDMHNTDTRKCNMQPAYEKAVKMYKNRANELFESNAKSILEQQKALFEQGDYNYGR